MEWTKRGGDFQTVFVKEGEKVRKVAEWRLISDEKMIYTAYNKDGSINTRHTHTGAGVRENWDKYINPITK